MPFVPRRAGQSVSRLFRIATASLCVVACAHAQEGTVSALSPVAALPGAICPADEDMFKAVRIRKGRGFVRVEYEFILRNETRWANMNADLVRKLKVRVGETFCMTRDTGSPESAAVDLD